MEHERMCEWTAVREWLDPSYPTVIQIIFISFSVLNLNSLTDFQVWKYCCQLSFQNSFWRQK